MQPLRPAQQPDHRGPGAVRVVAVTVPAVPALFVPTLAPPPRRVGAALSGMATVDSRGRLAEQAVMRGLGWSAGTPIDVRVWGGLVLVAAGTGAGNVVTAAIEHRVGVRGLSPEPTVGGRRYE